MAKSLQLRQPTPMLEMNLTPLIDVLLVLLVMFIITIPLQSHAVKIDLPQRPPDAVVNPIKNKIVITPQDEILWNGAKVTEAGLTWNLFLMQRMQPAPELHLQPHPAARYEIVDEVLALTKQTGVTNMGFVGNEAYRRF